ncbi:hypothetical protein [Alishewanella sp. HH-ZS]|uniref:hypothetical protein n=1 Tax=Alishewanella sp. HH-ZS TaxID=1856684 RepID=UPI001146E123|nr:hypothetical protein [Alishewanella sp. HH-ZS]
MTKMVWPADNPKHLVLPPEHAAPINAKLFRFVNKIPADQSDFLPSFKDPEQSNLAQRNIDNPEFYATSFFSDKMRVMKLIETNPEKFRKKIVANGMVTPDLGYAHSNSRGHVSVWFYENCYPTGFVRHA